MEPDFKLLSVRDQNEVVHPCMLVDGKFFELSNQYSSVRQIIEDWDDSLARIQVIASSPESSNLSPLARRHVGTENLRCTGNNY